MMIRHLRRCHLPLLALVSFFQLLALALCQLMPESAPVLAPFFVLCLAALLLCAAVPGRMRAALLCAYLLVLFGAAHLLLPAGAATAIMSAGCAAILFFAISLAGKEPAQASPMFFFACVLAQVLALLLEHHANETAHSLAPIQCAFYLWLPLFLLAFNRISLNNATLARYRLSAGMARAGTALTLCVYLLALLLCALPAVVSAILWIFGALREGSIRLLVFLINLFPSETGGGAMGGGMPMLPEGAAPVVSEPSAVAVLLEKIAAAVSVIVLIAGCAALLRLLALALVRLARSMLAHLKRYAAAVTEDYEDEITDTRTEDGERTFILLRRKVKPKAVYPDTPAGHIRRRYAQLLAQHSEWAGSSTARENLPPSAASLYEQARYSTHTPSQEDAQRFERETK